MQDDEFIDVHGVKFHIPPALAKTGGKPRRRKPSAELRERALAILSLLRQAYPNAGCTLTYQTPLQLLVAAILAAHGSDERVNEVTAQLFRVYPTVTDYAGVAQEVLARDIRSIGLQREKAANIRAAAAAIVRDFGGCVPDTMEGLLSLPGVGRKTANLVLSAAFGKSEGIIVDTHVRRVSERLGLVTVLATRRGWVEHELTELIPKEDWAFFSFAMVLHGRRVCTARDPGCARCPLANRCRGAG